MNKMGEVVALPYLSYEVEDRGWNSGDEETDGVGACIPRLKLSIVGPSTEKVQMEKVSDNGSSSVVNTETALYTLPHAVRIQDLPEEAEIHADFMQGLGALAVGQVIKKPIETISIFDHIEWAANGDSAALEEDASLALAEAILEVGVNEVTVELDHEGEFAQHGHRLRDVLSNTIRLRPGNHAILHETTRTEGKGLATMNVLERAGYFDQGYVWVVPRMVPVGVLAADLRDYGYFENLAVSWGVVWKRPDGTFTMRTLFTAGVTAEAHEEVEDRAMTDAELDAMIETRLQRRHDIQAVMGLYAELNLPVTTDIADFQRGFIVHKDQFKHEGEYDVDIAAMYDSQLGPDFFLGRHAPREDYAAHSRNSISNMRRLDEMRDAVVAEMLTCREIVADAMSAARLLARLSRKHAINYVIDHPEVDAKPLGRAAENLRNEYLYHVRNGDHNSANLLREQIHRVARVNMCGFGAKNESIDEIDDRDRLVTDEETTNIGVIRCINCRKYVPKAEVVKKDCWECPKCKYAVDICDGRVLNEGQAVMAGFKPTHTAKLLGGLLNRRKAAVRGSESSREVMALEASRKAKNLRVQSYGPSLNLEGRLAPAGAA